MLLEAKSVSAKYDDTLVLIDFDFEARDGEIVALLGPNGSGKTTLLRCLSRVLQPSAGKIFIDGNDLFSLSAQEASRLIAVVPQQENPVFDFTVYEVVKMGRYPWNDSNEAPDAERLPPVEEALEETGLTELAHRPISTLSGGERQRVLIARALAQTPKILLLDEPTAHLDFGHQILFLDIMRKYSHKGKIVVAALHDLNFASALANRAVLIFNGRKVCEGKTEEVLASEELERVYGASFTRTRDPLTGKLNIAPELIPERAQTAHPLRIHLIGGGGSAAALLTELWQLGHKISLGITHESDSDFVAAKRFECPCVTAPPFSPFDENLRAEALALANDADIVILCASPYGKGNIENLRLAEDLLEKGKTLWVLKREEKPWDFTGGEATKIIERLLQRGAKSIESTDVAKNLETFRPG
ncbi:MAG TPA: ATP-binding cassette domain-containing protein [Fimbriimonadales bacterium]|nr:ATP-binding cassette domain-containing protein [Fimbriimonadales bacterium]